MLDKSAYMYTTCMAKLPKSGGGLKITPHGHTFSGHFGSEPNAKVRGRSEQPTEQSFK